MNEIEVKKDLTDPEIENTEAAETIAADAAEEADMDLEEALLVAKVMARAMYDAENPTPSGTPPRSEEELLAEEAAEQAEKKTLRGRLRTAFRKFASVILPDNRKFALPAIIAEILALAAVVIILGRYSHVAPETPVHYSNPEAADRVTCDDGLLIVNDVNVKVPKGDNVKYSISYVWAEDDKDYPSVPHAIVASYFGEAASGDSGSEEDASAENGNAEDAATENADILYDISLYKDSFTPKRDIPSGKDHTNWFSGWKEEKTDDSSKFALDVGDIHGFCISTLGSKNAAPDYRSLTYYFAVRENGGISVYVLEGISYDQASRKEFRTIIRDAVNSIRLSN